jgi:hypothetical protein
MSVIKYTKFWLDTQSGQIMVDLDQWYKGCRYNRKYHFMYCLGLKFRECWEKYPYEEMLFKIIDCVRKYGEIIMNLNHQVLRPHLAKDLTCFVTSLMRTYDIKCPLVCYQCGTDKRKNGKKLKKCSGCKCAWYCSEKCQKKDWLRHRLWCYQDPNKAICGICEKPTKKVVYIRYSGGECEEICRECHQTLLDDEKEQKDKALREAGVPI